MRVTLSFLAFSLIACSNPAEPDAGSSDGGGIDARSDDGGPDANCVAPVFDVGDPNGAADPLGGVGPGQARAGRLTEAQLPFDPLGLATWRAGDLVLANSKVAAIISVGTARAAYDPYDGRLVGLALVRDGALVDRADFSIVLLGFGRFIVSTQSVSVMSDGTAGGSAIVRAAGTLTAVRALGTVLDSILPGDFTDMPAALEYEIAPDTDYVDVYLSVSAGPRGARSQLGALQVFFQSFRLPAWVPVSGFGTHTGNQAYLAFDGQNETSYAWMAQMGSLNGLVSTQGADVFTTPTLIVDACSQMRFPVGRVVLAGPGLAPLQNAVAALQGGGTTRRVQGTVLEANGTPAAGVRVHVTTETGEHLTRMSSGADGTFDFQVDMRAAHLTAYRAGQPLVGPLDLLDGPNMIVMPATGTIEVTAHLAGGAPMPARVEVTPATGPPTMIPESFGEVQPGAGRELVDYPADGHSILRIAPGSWQVRVSRGPEYEILSQTVDVAADATMTIDAALSHSVDTTGVMCADYHIHSHRSVDSADDGNRKLMGLIANGLEIPIRSEHEWVSDYQPVVERLGLTEWAHGLGGLELTTFTYGHFGVFPLVPDSTRPGDGAVVWYDRFAPDVFDEVRARPEHPALIINHPRSTGIHQGYFNDVEYDPLTGTVGHPENWDTEFTVIEAFNSSDFESNRETTVRDWLALLHDRHVFVVGSSDSHHIDTVPVGYPRTCLALGSDDPRAITPEMVRDVTMAGHSYVSGGIYLDVTGPNGTHPGDSTTGVGDHTSFDVVVRAASWISVDRLEVIVDGVSTVIPITPADADPSDSVVRARMTVGADVAATGSFVIVHAVSDVPFDLGNRPFAVSNPIFVSR